MGCPLLYTDISEGTHTMLRGGGQAPLKPAAPVGKATPILLNWLDLLVHDIENKW